MFDIRKTERIVIIFLIAGILSGLGIIAYKKTHSSVDVGVKDFSIGPASPDDLDDIIRESRIVNINTANAEDLMRLKGIGQVLAGRIIDYRSANGRFSSADEIKKVKGVGEKLFEAIKNDIAVE